MQVVRSTVVMTMFLMVSYVLFELSSFQRYMYTFSCVSLNIAFPLTASIAAF